MVKLMDKSINHLIEIKERKTLIVTGLKKLESFDNKEFFLETIMGYILIKGNSLELLKLDTIDGILSIKGQINSINYIDNKSKKTKEESIISKLFK